MILLIDKCIRCEGEKCIVLKRRPTLKAITGNFWWVKCFRCNKMIDENFELKEAARHWNRQFPLKYRVNRLSTPMALSKPPYDITHHLGKIRIIGISIASN